MTAARFGRDQVTDVIAAMEHYDTAWHRELADYLTADGDIADDRRAEYERAKDDHARPDTSGYRTAALRAAIAAAAPETTP